MASGAGLSHRSESLECEYRINVVLWRQPHFLKQLALALGGGLLGLGLLLLVLGDPGDLAWILQIGRILALTAAIIAALVAIVLACFYRGGYEYIYRLNQTGITGRPSGRTARTNRIINALLMLSGKPGPAGAGWLASSRQTEEVQWRQIDRASLDERNRTISLYAGAKRKMVIFVEPENRDEMLTQVRSLVAQAQAAKRNPA